MRYIYALIILTLFTLTALGQSGYFGSPVGAGGGTTIPDQNCSPDVMQSITGGTFGCTPLATPIPIPVTTPVPGQGVVSWNGTSFDLESVVNSISAGSAQVTVSCTNGACALDVGAVEDGSLSANVTKCGSSINGGTCIVAGSVTDADLASTFLKTTGTQAMASGTLDLSAITWFKLPIVNGTYGSCANAILYYDSADASCPIHYCNGATDTGICGVTAGTGLAGTGTLTTDSTQSGFLANGALTCGSTNTFGKIQVHTTPLQYCDKSATNTLRYAAYGDNAGVATSAATSAAFTGTREQCKSIEQLKDTDDGVPLFSFAVASTVTGVWCTCTGTCASTLATPQLYLKDGTTALTGGNPTCAVSTSAGSISAVTANNSFAAGETVKMSITNTPTNNAVDTYLICISYTTP